MKKQVVSISVAIILGISKPAMAFWGAGAADLGASVPTFPSLFGSSSPSASKPTPLQEQEKRLTIRPREIIELLRKQLEETKKIHNSITGNRQLDIRNPEIIYNQNVHSAISQLLESILKEEEIPISIRQSRDSIGKRIQYATAIDKIVSSQTFQETEKRFNRISELVKKINTTTDLKSIAELEAHIKAMLAIIQNETTKLQVVAYSRNTEQALISQQKQKRNMKILNSENKGMPIIRSVR